MKLHKVTVHEGRKKTCERCGREFGYSSYHYHLPKCHGIQKTPTKVLCSICGAVYVKKKSLNAHLTAVHGEGNFVPKRFEGTCSDCGKVFKSKDFFFAHMFLQHGQELPGLKKYPCPDCDEVFYTKCYLKNHAMLHTEKKYTCSDCGYQTRFSGNLSKHVIGVHKKRSVAYRPLKKSSVK
jgi:predicted RNA-binding Zn-ribbon protein involved in translation (DUF1610 family)